jgi:hypothetical protein
MRYSSSGHLLSIRVKVSSIRSFRIATFLSEQTPLYSHQRYTNMAAENNENLLIQAAHSDVGWRTFLGLCAQQEQLLLKEEALHSANSFRATPLSPKNQLLLPSPRDNKDGRKRAAFDDQTLLTASKRTKASHEVTRLGLRQEELSAPGGPSMIPPAAVLLNQLRKPRQVQQAVAASSLFLNPAFVPSGYNNAATTQQFMLAQALASSGSMPTILQRQLNNIIASEISRFATTVTPAAATRATNGTEATVHAKFPLAVNVPEWSPSSGMVATKTNNSHDPSAVACLDLGDEFLRTPGKKATSLCDCGMALCHEIGYPNRGTVAFPDDNDDLLLEWCHRLDITNPQRLRCIQANPAKFRLATWHFTNHASKRPSIPDQSLQVFVDEMRDSSISHKLRQPTQRMTNLHNYWAQVRRLPTLEP